MASHLRRCRRCRQAVLGDARCCPHCAVPRPTRRRLVRGLVLSAATAAVLGFGLRGVGNVDGDAPSAAATPSLRDAVASLFDDPPEVVACRRRGGTLVRVSGPWLSTARRCAIGFDDGEAP